ncbi:hypothetical protein NB037_15020 [Rathayibacter sp. ZW T2_19]|uniref:Isochorismatase family protein n=1 Tax=Rathayibacter rubneri TaxID=2950106 RepID=A0A9X2E0M9_9MICO|nr:hypothetical protein [Rathayibacter rubneri]
MELGLHVTLVSDATAAFSEEGMLAATAAFSEEGMLAARINGPMYAHAILGTSEVVDLLAPSAS